jgi:uncharacterized protein YecT (DUF1311 family)
MTLQLKSDRHPSFGPGFALLTFDRPINAIRVEISILNTITGLYLGASMPGRANWIKQQTQYFPAVRVGGENSRMVRVGPEITSYIQEGTYVELATSDGSIQEEVSWEGILQRFNPAGTENWFYSANADELPPDDLSGKDKRVNDDETAKEKDRLEREKREREQKEKEAQLAAAEAEKKRAADEAAAAADRVADQAAKALAAKKEKEEKAAAALLAGQKAAEAEAAAKLEAAAAAARAAARRTTLKTAGRYLLGLLVVLAAAAGAYQAFSSGYLCSRFGLFCDQETLAFREVESCSRGKTCGAGSCTAPYLSRFPSGAHIAEVNRINHDAGAACVDDEKEVFDRAVGCANEREQSRNVCGVAACFDEFKSRYPGSTRLNAEQTRLQRNVSACTDRTREKATFDEANRCAISSPCDTTCFRAYRARYPNGFFRDDMETAMTRARALCVPPPVVTSPPVVTTPPIVAQPPPLVTLPVIRRRGPDDVPSTNCSKATKPVEQMLCYDGDLARADGELGDAFKQKRRTSGDTNALRQSEIDWIARRDSECGIPPSGTWTEMDLRRAKNCLLQKTYERRDELNR